MDQADWNKGQRLQPGVREIYEDARLSSKNYNTHNTKTLDEVSAFKYNDAVRELSKKNFNGRLPHQLDADEARKLVDAIQNISFGEAAKDAPEYIKRISTYNKGVLNEIAEAEVIAGNASRLARTEGQAAGIAADTAKSGRGIRAAGKIGKVAKVVAPAVVVYVLVADGPAAAAETTFYMTPAGDVVTIGKTGIELYGLVGDFLNAVNSALDAQNAGAKYRVENFDKVNDRMNERKKPLTMGTLQFGE